MDYYQYLILLIALSAAFAYINQRFIKLPFVIGIFLLATLLSLSMLVIRPYVQFDIQPIRDLMTKTDVSKLIMNVMLAFLLFAGAMHTNWAKLKKTLKPVLFLAFVGVVISSFLIAGMLYYVTDWLGMGISFHYCLLFGALISPTDPIAVLGILKKAKVPAKLETTIVGESLFNDGMGIVLFIAMLDVINPATDMMTGMELATLFTMEVGGGILFGFILGYLLHVLVSSIDHYETEILLTLAFVMGGYWMCSKLHVSGPLAMVLMGLMMGNFRTEETLTEASKAYVHKFWELLDVILNAILFILVALVITTITLHRNYLLLGLISIGVILLARTILVTMHRRFFPSLFGLGHPEAKIIIWGGLRGGVSIALVLSLPESEYKQVLSVITYIVVVFSILVQGLTVGPYAQRLLKLKE